VAQADAETRRGIVKAEPMQPPTLAGPSASREFLAINAAHYPHFQTALILPMQCGEFQRPEDLPDLPEFA
jgi:hypothetical protein